MLQGNCPRAFNEPDKQPRRSVAMRVRGVRAGVIAAALPLSFAAGQAPAVSLGPLPETAAVFRADFAAALAVRTVAARTREAQLERASADLQRARLGFELVFEADPEAEMERDLASGTTTWDAELGLSLAAGLSLDEDRVLRAEAALVAAEVRLRDQVRSDQRAALLALSDVRRGAVDLEEAEEDAATAVAELEAARSEGAGPEDLRSLELEARLADVELRRERVDHEGRLARLEEFGLPVVTAACEKGLLSGPLAAVVTHPAEHSDAARLRIAFERAQLAWRNQPFEALRELELTGAYEDGGVEFSTDLGVRRGVPSLGAEVGWSTGASSGRSVVVGVSATLAFSADSPSRTTLVREELDDAEQELAAFAEAQAARESAALTLLELSYEELALLIDVSDAAALAAASATVTDDRSRLENAAERARADLERTWQGYVRALFAYLDEIDAVLSAPPCGASSEQLDWMRWS